MLNEIIFDIYLRKTTENRIEIKIFTKCVQKPSFVENTIEFLEINNELHLLFTTILVLFVIIVLD